MASPLKRVAEAFVGGVGRRTQPSRERIAVTGFFLGTESILDRMLSRSYFEMSNWAWAGYEADEGHHLSFRMGLARVPLPPSVVVDLGTGAGGTAAQMARMWPDARVTGIDSSRQMVRLARRRHGDVSNLTFSVGDGLHLALAEAAVELVTSLNYMPFPSEVRRILRPGGRALVASTFQAVGSKAVAAHWEGHGFVLEAQDDAAIGSFELYRRVDLATELGD